MNTQIKSLQIEISKHFEKYSLIFDRVIIFRRWKFRQHINQLQRTDIEQIICQISEQLEFIHNNGYVYKDLKPSNILFGIDPESPNSKLYKLCDFGTIRKVYKTETVYTD